MNLNNYQSSALLTDLYQLTMAYGYWKLKHDKNEVVFQLTFRSAPYGSNYIVFSGLELVLEVLQNFSFSDSDIEYLASILDRKEQPLFSKEFLDYLSEFRLEGTVFSLPEGSIVFPNEPVLRVHGRLIECQMLETFLLNTINFHSLISTKASRIYNVSRGKPVLEFGLRRAQGADGGMSASRAAYIGGCSATSNVLASKIYGIPLLGTHSHSWVMNFDKEKEAFDNYVRCFENNCVLLIDTYDTIQGIKTAIQSVKENLPDPTANFVGVRLDSGDLAYLSKKVRRILDDNHFYETKIFASNNLDEYIIHSLSEQGACIDFWAVGTKLITSDIQPFLSGVYKLTALKKNENWEYKLKISNDINKINNPGILQIRRFYDKKGKAIADAIYDELSTSKEQTNWVIVNPINEFQQKRLTLHKNFETWQDLLFPVLEKGKMVYRSPSLEQIRAYTLEQLQKFDDSIKRLVHPHIYLVGLEKGFFQTKQKLLAAAKIQV